MAEPISLQQLKDASLDVKSLEEVVNGDENVVVTTRLGETYPSIKSVLENAMSTLEFVTSEADRTEAASIAAFVNADVYPDVATGRAAVADGEQFQVVSSDGYDIIRYERVSEGVSPEVARYSSSKGVLTKSNASLFSGEQNIKIDTALKTLTVDTGYVVQGKKRVVVPTQTISYDYEPASSRRFIAVNMENGALSLSELKGDISDSHITTTIGSIIASRNTIYGLAGGYLVDGSPSFMQGKSEYGVILSTSNSLNFNFDDGKIEITGTLQVPFAGGRILVPAQEVSMTSVAYSSWGLVAVNPKTLEVSVFPANLSNEMLVILGAFRRDGDGERVTGFADYSINGKPKDAFLPAEAVETLNIQDSAVTPEKTSFIRTSPNLYNERTTISGKLVNSSGEVVDARDYSLSDFIPVKPSTTYASWADFPEDSRYLSFVNMSEWDKDKNFIRRFSFTGDPRQRTTTPTTQYVRVDYTGGYPDTKRMFFEGVDVPEYEPYGNFLDGVSLTPKDSEDSGSTDTDKRINPIMIDTSVEGLYQTENTYDDLPNFRELKSSEVYGLWDDLMASYPEYISKKPLGNDAFGNAIALYRLSPTRPITLSEPYRVPKIFLTSGIHGGEDVSGMGTYCLVEALCNKWQEDPLLEALRFNVEFLIIPVVNPSGWDARSRKNGNGVDLNRNFPYKWSAGDPSAVTYGGTAPLSELETQYIDQVLDENRDIDAFYDAHNYGRGGATGGTGESFIWLSLTTGKIKGILSRQLIQKMTRLWKGRYSWLPDDESWFAGYSDGGNLGPFTGSHAYIQYGIELSGTFEVCNVWQQQPEATYYSPEHKQAVVETYVNWMLLNVQEIVNRG